MSMSNKAKMKLPRITWLVSRYESRFVTNTFTSSLGTPADSGCVGATTFNYRVFADISSDNENDFFLVAESFIALPLLKKGGKIRVRCAKFECSDEGVCKAAEWLFEEARKNGF